MPKTTTLLIFLILHLCYLTSAELNLQDIEIPDMDDFSAIKEKCDKLGGNGTYDTLKTSKDNLQSCLQGFVDFTVLKNEVEEAKKTGSMDEVFGKYCNKRPKLSSCVQNFTSALRPCLNEEESKALNTTLDILKQLGEFVCYRDGDRIAMFVAEGGVECIKDHTEGIKNCANKTLKVTPTVNTNSFPNLLMDKKKCDDLGKLQNCVVEELEKCQDSTPANIIDALFRFIKRSACSNKQKRSIHSIMRRSLAVVNTFYNSMELRRKYLNAIKDKCEQNAPEGGYEAFNEAFNKTTECLKKTMKDNPMFNTPVEEFKENVKCCFKQLIDKLGNCFAEDEKFWPQYQVDVLLNLIDVAYRNQELIRRPTSRIEMVNCFQNFKQQRAMNDFMTCVDKPEENGFTKETYCKRIKTLKDCFSQEYKKRCIREVSVTRLLDEIFAALSAPPCDKV